MVPVGGLPPATVTVNATFWPTIDGFGALASAVVVAATLPLTTCDNALLVEVRLAASPRYTAVMLCVPTLSDDVAHCAVRVPTPVSATALQATIVLPASLKSTPPPGLLPLTVAVNVTACPLVDGLRLLPTVVVVAVGPPPPL